MMIDHFILRDLGNLLRALATPRMKATLSVVESSKKASVSRYSDGMTCFCAEEMESIPTSRLLLWASV